MPAFSLSTPNYSLTASNVSSSVSIVPGFTAIRILNPTSVVVFVRATKGASTAVTTDTPIGPGVTEAFSIPVNVDTISVITSSGGGTVYVKPGEGE